MGRIQAFAIAILSFWIGLTLAMWFVATRSFRTVDRVLSQPSPEFTKTVEPLGPDQTRVVLRHLASEINRTLFGAYGWAQILLGVLLVLLLWRQTPRDTIGFAVAWVMLCLAFILTLFIQPWIISIGRSIDFVPRQPAPPMMRRFWMLHGAFTGLDGVKCLAGLGLLLRWILAK
jgi:Domain of unknown function (DUF4149)